MSIVHGNMDKFDKEGNEAHDGKANRGCYNNIRWLNLQRKMSCSEHIHSGAVPGKTGKTAVLPQFSQEKCQLVFLTE